MNLPKIAIENAKFTLIIFILLILLGVQAFLTMPRTEDPTIYVPGGSVIVIYPGASPNDLEQLVAFPVEEAINELDDILMVKTEIKDGLSVTSVEFSYNTDAKEKYDELVRQINSIQSDLPEDIFLLDIMQWRSSDVAIMQLALVSDKASYSRMNERAEQLKRELEKQKGVKKVALAGVPDEVIRINLNFEKMARMNISLDQIINALKSNNANIPGGSVTMDGKSFMIKSGGGFKNLEEIRRTVVNSHNGKILHLEQVAELAFTDADDQYIARLGGAKAIFVTIEQKEGYNIFEVVDGIKPVIGDFSSRLEPDLSVHYVFDQSEGVKSKIGGFLSNLVQGIILVGFVILLALGFRSSLIVILAIPLSILIGLSLVNMADYGLQQISIAALVVALGLLVDNSIVMVENINRFMLKGLSSREAAVKGASEIAWPVVTATLTTLFAFIPIITMPDKAGDFIKSLPFTIIATLSVSLLIALSITPLASAVIFKRKKPEKKNNVFRQMLDRFIQGPYRRTLRFALKHKLFVILIAVLAFVGSMAMFPLVGLSFFPPSQTPQFMVRVEMPEGTAIQKTNRVVRYVESVLDTSQYIQVYASNIGHGNPRIYYNIMSKNYAPNYGEIYVRLKRYEQSEYDQLISGLRKVFADYPGAKITIKEYQQGVPLEAPVMVYLLGDNQDVLQQIAEKMEQVMLETPGMINVNNKLKKMKTDLVFQINKDKAGMLGVPVVTIEKSIRTAINGIPVTTFRDKNGKEYDIVLRAPSGNEVKPGLLDQIFVSSLAGKQVPLRQLGSIQMEESPALISRYNLQRSALLTADLIKGSDLD
ncbi:MAG: efflux RND transporter permease subunit, partial [Bacteroidales bacterium]|nr:efflux RND transporter permease subunit [Bacteroidales bacterium]